MKRLIKSLAALALVVSMVGCSNESSEGQLESSTNVELKLKGNIASLKPSTRVNADGFEANDKVGVYVSMNNTLAQQGNTLDNEAFTYNNGAIVAPEGKEVYWGSKDVRISVWAYYPYDADISDNSSCDFVVAADQSEAADFYCSDFVLASSKNLAPQEAPVGLTFNHTLSKVVFEFEQDGNTTAEHLKKSITKVMINGLCVDGSIDLADGSVTLGSSTATITPNKVSDLNYAAIVYPQEGTLSLRVQFGEDIYLYSADVDYEPGYQYKYTLKVDLRKPQEMTLKAVEISGWEDGDDTEGVMFDIISFADEKFKEYLLGETLWKREGNTYVASGKIDANNDGEISIAEAEKVEKIHMNDCGVTDLSEIRYFVNLKELASDKNLVKKLDLSSNPALENLSFTHGDLEEINVSKNTLLKTLHCYCNKLTALDVSNLIALGDLKFHVNQVTEIDVSNCPELMVLDMSKNKITEFDVSNNVKLEYLYCYEQQGITSVDISNNVALKVLWCNDCSLESLDLLNNINLRELRCQKNQLASLDVSENTELYDLCCDQNLLETLDVSTNIMLGHLDCSKNKLTALDLSKNTELYDLSCANNQLSVLDLSNNTKLSSLYCVAQEDEEGNNLLETIYIAEGQVIDNVDKPDATEIKVKK